LVKQEDLAHTGGGNGCARAVAPYTKPSPGTWRVYTDNRRRSSLGTGQAGAVPADRPGKCLPVSLAVLAEVVPDPRGAGPGHNADL